jgi:RNA polymerase sigma-70 factor (ECF subfamily)
MHTVAAVEGVDWAGVSAPSCDLLSDSELLGRIAAEDRLAFRAFYDRHSGRMLSVLRHLCGNDDLAEDLLQDVFLLVWRKAPSYRPERGEVAGWLYAIARNRVADTRRGAPRPRRLGTDEVLVMPAATPAVEDEMRLTLQEVLASLAPEQREAVDLAYFSGLTYAETAERLSLPLGTLKSRVRAALARLKESLDP